MSEAVKDPGGAAGRDGDGPPDVQTGTLFEMLGNERRRHVIDCLREREAATSLDALADQVAARENDTSVEAVTDHERKRVYTSLQQTHLPKMDEAGVLDFEKGSGTVTPSDRLTEYTLHLDVAPAAGITMSAVYLGLSAVGVGLFLLALVGPGPLGRVPPLGLAAAVVGLFGAVAALSWYVRPDYETGR
jgi:predicted transcriptional regulator